MTSSSASSLSSSLSLPLLSCHPCYLPASFLSLASHSPLPSFSFSTSPLSYSSSPSSSLLPPFTVLASCTYTSSAHSLSPSPVTSSSTVIQCDFHCVQQFLEVQQNKSSSKASNLSARTSWMHRAEGCHLVEAVYKVPWSYKLTFMMQHYSTDSCKRWISILFWFQLTDDSFYLFILCA